MDFQYIHVLRETAWWEATIRRPEALNALNAALLAELEQLIETFRSEPSARGLTLTGDGPKAFVAGADIKELAGLDAKSARGFSERGQRIFDSIEGAGRPVIAAVNGFALGGGLELALACHLRVFARTAKVGLPEVSLGAIPGYGGTQRLARLVGAGRALEMILSGDPIDAETALRIGLANRVVEPEELLDVCRALAARIQMRSPKAVSEALDVVLRGRSLSLTDALSLEAERFARLAETHDWKEGTSAFLEKRKPAFEGR